MKGSSATSARATARPPHTGRSSAPPTRTSAEGFVLAGPSNLPDPARNAYRRDLADVALAGQVIASHYAEPLGRVLARPAELRAGPTDQSESLGQLSAGAPFAMLDNSRGWAWGYAGEERLVGYVSAEAIAAL